MSMKDNLLFENTNKYFVETGSYSGDGIQLGIEAGINYIRSIELANKLFNECKEKFKDYTGVTLIQGDSSLILSNVISDIDEQITFWLDAHYSGGDTVQGHTGLSALIAELEQIKQHPIKTHTIMIDDIRWCYMLFGTLVKDKIMEINSDYEINYADGSLEKDILVAKVKNLGKNE